MNALRIQVERVVRPLRASSPRKDRMREELLGHLLRLYNGELLRTGNAEAATAAAIGRFGDAQALSRELQDSVPYIERWAMSELAPRGRAKRRVGESPTHYILRSNAIALAAGLITAGLLALPLLIVCELRPHRFDARSLGQVLLFMLGVIAIEAVAMFGCALLCERMRQLMERRAAAPTAQLKRRLTWRIAGHAVGSSVIVGAALAGGMLLFDGLLQIPLVSAQLFWGISLAAALLSLPTTLLQAWSWRAATRRFDNWESLDLEGDSAN